MRPMLATRGTHVPTGDEWTHEVKWDGMRVLVDTRDRVRLTSRNENDVSVSFPELQGLPAEDVLLDGEVVAFGDGIPTFGSLADRMHVSNPRRAAALANTNPVTLLVFDVLRYGDRDLSRLPLAERREILLGLDLNDDRWQTPPAYDDGPMLFDATRQQGLEGIVSKRLDSRYEFGAAHPELAQVRAPPAQLVRRGRLAARDGIRAPARCVARGRAHPRRASSTAAGSAAGSPARSDRCSTPCSHRTHVTAVRSSTRFRSWTPSARTGWSR